MERRLLTFVIASTAFLLFYAGMRAAFGPPVRPVGAQAKRPAPVEEAGGPKGAKDLLPAADPQDATDESATDPADTEAEQDLVAAKRPEQPKRVTLGSMDPASKQLMMVTLNSQGGAVERIELTERDDRGQLMYRRVDVRYGYLGYLAGEPAATVDGVKVNVVGPGTPAATAIADADATGNGLRVGDIVIGVADRPVATNSDIKNALSTTKPGDQVTIEVLRSGDKGEPSGNTVPLKLTATLTEHPLDLIRLAEDGGPDQIAGNLSHLSCLMTLGQVNRKGILTGERSIIGLVDPSELVWDADVDRQGDSQTAEFSVALSEDEMGAVGGGPVRLQRSYTLNPGSYVIDMAVQVDNLSDQPQDLAYRLEGPNGLTLEGWWYSNKISPNFSGAAARDVVYRTAADNHVLISGYELLKRAKNKDEDDDQAIFASDGETGARTLNYIGVDAQYFCVAYLPPGDQNAMTTFRRASAGIVAAPGTIKKHKERAVNVSYYLDSVRQQVPPGASMRQELKMFAGPKQPELLARYGLGQFVYYGWFAMFAKVLGTLLHFLHGLVQNYAVAIVLLTLLVRAAMFPLSRKAAINAQRMQELAPELKKIADQYKDDMEGRLKAQRDLQKRVGFNPMAGCLPMFLQLPIFIGLYRALSVDIELRQEAVSPSIQWASNLAGPDMFSFWGDWLWDYLSGRGTGWLGPYFNILPVVVVVLFLTQQKLFMPPATDEQTRMTQKMMNIMTLMMGLFFFRVPAGLCLYFITSSLWGIAERILVKKTLPSGKHFDLDVVEGTVNSSGAAATAKPTTIKDKIREHIAPSEPPPVKPNKRKRPGGKKK